MAVLYGYGLLLDSKRDESMKPNEELEKIMAQQVSSAFNAVATSASITGGASMSITQTI